MFKKYKSHKVVEAKPMQAGLYRVTRKPQDALLTNSIPSDEAGYLVVYSNGYKSWSPKKAFDEGYTPYISSDKYTAVAAACALSASIGAAIGSCFLFFVATVLS